MHKEKHSLMGVAEAMWPDKEVKELMDIADRMNLSERLVDMKQVMAITTLSRRTLLNLEQRGEFPERVHVTPGRKAWYLSEVVAWINNIPCQSASCPVPVPKKPGEALCLKVERVKRLVHAGKSKFLY